MIKLESIKEGIKELDELREKYNLRLGNKLDIKNEHECYEVAAWLSRYERDWSVDCAKEFQEQLDKMISLQKKHRAIQAVLKKIRYNAYNQEENNEIR